MLKAKEHILVVDDEYTSRYVTRKILEGAGYLVSEGSDASEGLNLARLDVPHLIVLDLMMRPESGFEFLEACRQMPELHGIAVLVASDLKDANSIARATNLGAMDYVTKPIDTRTFLQKILKLLRDRSLNSFVFPAGMRPKVKAQANGKILMANETCFFLSAPFKVAPESPIDVYSPTLNKLGYVNCVFRKTSRPAQAEHPGKQLYLNEVGVAGLNQSAIKRIRRTLGGRK